MDSANGTQYVPPSALWMWLFPITYVIHLAEEYWGGEGYTAYLLRLRGVHMSSARFLAFQSLGVGLIIVGLIISERLRFPRFMLAMLGALVLSNGITHTVTAIRHGGYGPGLVASAVLWIPLGLVTLFHLFAEMGTLRYIAAVSIGLAINGMVALIALRGGRLV
jgi:hypothetical protein